MWNSRSIFVEELCLKPKQSHLTDIEFHTTHIISYLSQFLVIFLGSLNTYTSLWVEYFIAPVIASIAVHFTGIRP